MHALCDGRARRCAPPTPSALAAARLQPQLLPNRRRGHRLDRRARHKVVKVGGHRVAPGLLKRHKALRLGDDGVQVGDVLRMLVEESGNGKGAGAVELVCLVGIPFEREGEVVGLDAHRDTRVHR